MSAAGVTPIQGARPIDEPTNVRELYARAQTDLTSPAPGTLLRWIFWHARAVGRLEAARLTREKLVHHERDVRMVMISQISPSICDAIAEKLPDSAVMRGADEMLVEAATYVQASHDVIDLLRSRK